jgi:hypothetical protein
MKEGLSIKTQCIDCYKGGVLMGVSFFRGGRPFQGVAYLTKSEKEQFINRWNKWEEKLWTAAYQDLLEKLDPNETCKANITLKEKKDLLLK